MADDRRIVPLTTVLSEREAVLIVAALQENGITSTMSGWITGDFRIGIPGYVQVLVFEEDLAQAQQILAAVGKEDTDVDWSQVDVGEPEVAAEQSNASPSATWRPIVVPIGAALTLSVIIYWLMYGLWE